MLLRVPGALQVLGVLSCAACAAPPIAEPARTIELLYPDVSDPDVSDPDVGDAGTEDAGGMLVDAESDVILVAEPPVTRAPQTSLGVSEEVCNWQDDDLDGFVDEEVLNACGSCGETPREILVEGAPPADEDCDGRVDEGFLGGYCVSWQDCAQGGDGVDMDCFNNRCSLPCNGCAACNDCVQDYAEHLRWGDDEDMMVMWVTEECHSACLSCLHDCDPVGGVCVGEFCRRNADGYQCRPGNPPEDHWRQWLVETPERVVIDTQHVEVCY